MISTYPQELGWQWEEGRQGRQWSYSSPTSGEDPLRKRKSERWTFEKFCLFTVLWIWSWNMIIVCWCSGEDLRGWLEPTYKDKNLVVRVPQQHGNGQSLKKKKKRLVMEFYIWFSVVLKFSRLISLWSKWLKRIVHPKIQLSSFTQPYDFLNFEESQNKFFFLRI